MISVLKSPNDKINISPLGGSGNLTLKAAAKRNVYAFPFLVESGNTIGPALHELSTENQLPNSNLAAPSELII